MKTPRQLNFGAALKELESDTGFRSYAQPLHIKIPDARQRLAEGLNYYLAKQGRKMQWLPAYDEIANWLSDNEGRGLLCIGSCGLGKTLICSHVLPVIIYQCYDKIVTVMSALELNNRLDEAKHDRMLSVDDIGTEPESVKFGERHIAFSEVVDEAEKRGTLLIVTSNMPPETPEGSKYPSIMSYYGVRTLDRLQAITKMVVFKGKSFRN